MVLDILTYHGVVSRVRPMPTRPDVDVVEVVADQMPARPPLAQHLLDQCKRQLDHVGWGDGKYRCARMVKWLLNFDD
jgi:hypothetical protein